ncbi:glycosyltransferase [uncultured Desulfovibrio sp.]|uniref:glycosyltransferase family 8 protein n=1 Tax=uncultured Desulfovibrio sp. TaxID=167968 RepID=UPI002630EDC9|nr:glycosyltransferase [uncultured Desulfovibrio sp.]
MKTVFCLDDKIRYLTLLKVAVRSLRAVQGEDAPCLCLYAGQDRSMLDALAAERIPVARYTPRLDPSGFTPLGQACAGCFLKLELALVPELADDDMALYCDTDVLFYRPLDELFALTPPYMGMAREYTAPFYHEHKSLSYMHRGERYTVPMPFPIWTFSSGVSLFNLARLRKRGLIDHFLAFCAENESRIGNLDQSLLNYFFGKRITRLDDCWNCPPYREECRDTARIVHFHGPKPWETGNTGLTDLRINHFDYMRDVWMGYLTQEERALAQSFC